jgi:hypothetical protein
LSKSRHRLPTTNDSLTSKKQIGKTIWIFLSLNEPTSKKNW